MMGMPKMNEMNGKFKDKIKRINHRKLFSFDVKSCVYFQSFDFIET
jgi:hypothetical protein